jgi:hypothetical protein
MSIIKVLVMNKLEQKQLVLSRVLEWAGSSDKAEDWYCNQQIPALGCTPLKAVESDHFEALMEYIDSIELGGFA